MSAVEGFVGGLRENKVPAFPFRQQIAQDLCTASLKPPKNAKTQLSCRVLRFSFYNCPAMNIFPIPLEDKVVLITGASKWNPIEHRLFSEISKTWAGCPLESFALAARYIRATKTQTGLRISFHHVRKKYVAGEKISDELMATLNITYHQVCPQWNYTIFPRGYHH